jgi:hypothetical protein
MVSMHISAVILPKVPIRTARGHRRRTFLSLGQSHVVDGGQSRRAALAQGPLLSGKCSPIPLEGIVELSLVVEHLSHTVDGGQG